jgi:protein gp37
MGIKTDIEWPDSTSNIQMGCNGCELWRLKGSKPVRKCYAGVMTGQHGGKKGWPEAFDKPAIFPQRIAEMERWPDLSCKLRPDKPWLDCLPRMVFLNDMGDTFTESLPIYWLGDYAEQLERMPHVFMILTKRPNRAVQFCELLQENYGRVPSNFYFGTSVTSEDTLARAKIFAQINERHSLPIFLSVEPLWGPIDFPQNVLAHYSMMIIGGESGQNPTTCEVRWIEMLIDQCHEANVAIFVKQLGSKVTRHGKSYPLKHKKGGDMTEWPLNLRHRQFRWR